MLQTLLTTLYYMHCNTCIIYINMSEVRERERKWWTSISDTDLQTLVTECLQERRVQLASTGYVNFVVSESHLMLDQRQRSYTLLLRYASTSAMHSSQWHTEVWSWSTMSFIGGCAREGQLQAGRHDVPQSSRSGTSVPHRRTSDVASRLRLRSTNRHQLTSYLAVDSTHTAIRRFWSLVRRSGTRCLTSSEIRRVVLTVFKQFLKTIPFSLYSCDQRIRGYLKWYALYKSTFYLHTYILAYLRLTCWAWWWLSIAE